MKSCADEAVMGRKTLSDDVVPVVAERFKALSEPARLLLLRALMHGECTVNELVETTGFGQANVSKHLQVLHTHGFVRRRKAGLFVHYAIADRQVVKLCDTMSSRVGAPATDLLD
jgi:DNA-binding transcriptional ArsR family regulator